MSGVIKAVEWAETTQELYERYKGETDIRARKRLQVLWLVRAGQSARAAAKQAGGGERTVVRWLGWYREGGLESVLEKVPGHGATGAASRLSEEQKWLLVEQTAKGRFRTYEEAREWVEEEYQVTYLYKGMYSMLSRLQVHPKVPRPVSEKADAKRQEEWKKGA
jgi:transposase